MVVRLKDLDKQQSKSGVKRLGDLFPEYAPPNLDAPQLPVNPLIDYATGRDPIKQAAYREPDIIGTPLADKVDRDKTPGYDIPVIGSVLTGLDKFANFIRPASKVGGELYTPGLGAIGDFAKGAGAGVAKLLPGAGSLVSRVGGEAIAGGSAGVGQNLATGESDPKKLASGAAFGASIGAALPIAGSLIREIPGVNRFGQAIGERLSQLMGRQRQPAEDAIQEILALPAPGQTYRSPEEIAQLYAADDARLARESALTRSQGTRLPANDSIIPAQGKVADPLALPAGKPLITTRLRPADNNTALESVLNKIKEDIEPPTRRDLLVNYIQRNLDVPVDEVWNMPIQDLRELGQLVRQNMNVYETAIRAARQRGYDLERLLNNQGQGFKEAADFSKTKQAYGVYDMPKVNLKKPEQFRTSVTGEVAPPIQKGTQYVGERKLVRLADLPPETPQPSVRAMEPPTQTRPVQPPTAPPAMQERGFAQTLRESEKTPQGFKDTLKSAYRPITNQETIATANKRINKDVEEATSFVLGNSRYTAEKATTAQRLIDHYNQQGNFQRAVDIAEKVSEEATRAGQAIQALSMFNRLSPEGVLVYAQRLAKKANDALPVTAKEVRVTEDMAAKLTNLTQVTKQMTGVQDLSNNVMDILERAKAGEKLSDADAMTLRQFVNESRQFVKEATKPAKPPKPPAQPKDKRVRDNLVSFLDAKEQAAKERLRARGIQISSTPLDIWADYAVIGASKLAKGTVKFADWSEEMVKDLGESIRPQLAQLYERSKEAFELSSKTIAKKTISEAEKLTEKVIRGAKLEGEEAETLRELAKQVSSLSGLEKTTASQDLQKILQTFDSPSTLRKISSVQTIGQLLNPKTQVRNALGNELFYRIERLNKYLSTPIDIARSKLTGTDRTVTFKTNNQGQYWRNWLRGLKAGWKGVNVNGLETQYDLGAPAFRGKYNPLTYLEKALGASLKSFDTAAYMRAYNDTLGEMATLKALNEGQRGNKELIQKYIRESDDNLRAIADQYGRYVTFQDNNAISRGLVWLKRGLNFKQDFGLGDLILKYPKTPGALLMRALEYSPAGFVRSWMILSRPWRNKGEVNMAEVVNSLSRAIFGTAGLSGMGYFLMESGILTGAASKDKDIRELQKAAGQGQYQVNLSALKRFVSSNFDPEQAKLKRGDFLYTYDWMQPVSMAVSIGANVAKNFKEGKDGISGLPGTVYNSLEGGLGTLTEQSVLQGLKRAAEGYPGQTVTDKLIDILSDVPASFVPTAFNQARQLTDEAARETYDPNKLKQSLNKAQNRIPGLAGELPQQYDTLGRPKKPYQDNSLFNVLLNPGFSSRYTLTPEAKYVVDLINETGDESLAPRAPQKSITIDGQSVKLTAEQFAKLQQYQGEETRKEIESNMRKDGNKRLDVRVGNVKNSLADAGKDARDRLKKEMGR